MDDNDRSALVQQRIKKMLQKKKGNRESGDLTKRLKSNLGDKLTAEEEPDQMPKPSSSMRLRRPTSAMRPAESNKYITTNIATTSAKMDIDVRPIIGLVFEHGAKMKEFLKEKRMNRQELCQKIIEDQLFVLRLMGLLRDIPEEGWNEMAEKLCLGRIGKMMQREELIRRCEEAEKKVSIMLEERLRHLGKH